MKEEPYTSMVKYTTIDWERTGEFSWRTGKNTRMSSVNTQYFKNVYVDLDGTLKPKKFPLEGLWRYEGQVFVYEGNGVVK